VADNKVVELGLRDLARQLRTAELVIVGAQLGLVPSCQEHEQMSMGESAFLELDRVDECLGLAEHLSPTSTAHV
jgi:hypothetical protein